MSYDSQFLKWRMEQVWQQRGCVSPNHLARWTTYEKGYRVYDKEHTIILLWFTRGKLMRPRSKKVKGKGFSFLAKGYGAWWSYEKEKKAA